MQRVVSNQQMRDLDAMAIEKTGIPGVVLMENAGRNSALKILFECKTKRIVDAIILCGKGNNGGDGFVIARYLQKWGINNTVYLCAPKEEISGDAKTNLDICLNSGIDVREITATSEITLPPRLPIIIDALLGTGIKGAVKGFMAEAIEWINSGQSYVCSVDIPSGASGDTLETAGPVVKADFTVTMAFPKLSQLFEPVRSLCGTLDVVDIGLPENHGDDLLPRRLRLREHDISLPLLGGALYKQKAGKVLLLGGSPGMSGALILAARSATVCGAGLVIAGCARQLQPVLEGALIEQMTLGLPASGDGVLGKEAVAAAEERLRWADCIVLGPGLGRHTDSAAFVEGIIELALKNNTYSVIDADALFVLSQNPKLLQKLTPRFILTPHYGEFTRLLPKGDSLLQKQPWLALEAFLEKYDAVVNSKGAPSMVGVKQEGIFINSSGNPALAKGGSGDTLAGMIAAFCAAGMDGHEAAYTANYIHGNAADRWVQAQASRSMTQDDLLQQIKVVLNSVEGDKK